jgi:sialic acid synthase SpsE
MKFIADACCNHLGNKMIISRMIKLASAANMDYIKFQLYDHKKLNQSYSKHDDEYKEFLRTCEISLGTLSYIILKCSKANITPMFTIFTPDRLEMIKQFPIKFPLKIASCDANKPWVEDVVKFNKGEMVVISLGMSSYEEKQKLFKKYEINPDVRFLSCLSQYPCYPGDIDWDEVKKLNGFSCHTKDLAVFRKLIQRGIDLVEFHYTLSRNLPGKDHSFSLDYEDLCYINNMRGAVEDEQRYKNRFV